jgi:urease accessory protein
MKPALWAEPPAPPCEDGRHRAARLVFARGGGRTALARQIAPYPFHVTRPFALDVDRPDLATLYLQSASGGVYRGDELDLTIKVGSGASAHVTSQAATIVHDTGARPARMTTRLDVADGAFAALTLDPLVLFPGAELDVETSVTLADGALAILSDGVAAHDFAGAGRPFARLSSALSVFDGRGRLLLADRAMVFGPDVIEGSALLGQGARAFGNALILAPAERLVDPRALETAVDALGCLAAASAAPHGAGLAVRLLAPDGGQLARALDLVFSLAAEAMLGFRPARRRK